MADEVKIRITAEDKASGPLDSVGKKANALGSTLKGMLVPGALAAGAALGGLAFVGVGLVQAAAEEEASIQRLDAALKNVGTSTAQLGGGVEAFVAKMEALAVSDDQARSGLALLVAQTGSWEEAQKRAVDAADLARGANIDYETAARLVGKITDENVQVLKRYGITLADGATETEALAEIQRRFGGQAATFAGTAAGSWKRFTDQIGNVKEALGTALLPMVTKVAGAMATFLTAHMEDIERLAQRLSALVAKGFGKLSDWFQEHQPEIEAAARAIFAALGDMLSALRDIWGAVQPVLAELWSAFQTGLATVGPLVKEFVNWIIDNKPILIAVIAAIGLAIVTALGPVSLAVVALVGIITVIGLVRDHFQEIKDKILGIVKGLGEGLRDHWKMIVQIALAVLFPPGAGIFFIVTHFTEIKDKVLGIIKEFGEFLSEHWKTIVQVALAILFPPGAGLFFIVTHFSEIKDAVLGVASELGSTLLAGFTLLKSGLLGIWDGIKTGIKAILNSIIDAINAFAGGLNAASGLFNAVPGLPDIPTIPSIPHVARGGIATRPTLAVVGDAGPEAIIPLGRGGAGMGRWTNYGYVQYVFPNVRNERAIRRELDRQFRGS